MKPSRIADWQLPAGVTRGLWEYCHDERLAREYDESLRDSSLVVIDWQFVEEHCPQPGRLLDLGCGTGRMLLPLAARGFWVVGVDLSEEMLRLVGQKAQAVNLDVQRLQANIVELDGIKDETFDYVICLFSTLGMIAGTQNRQRVVQHAYRMLRPGGRFIVHVHNRWFNFWHRGGRWWLLQDCLRALSGSRLAGDRDMPVHDGHAALTLHHFTRSEITSLLRRTGFIVGEVRSVSLRADGAVSMAWWFGWLRAYGYLVVAQK